MGDEYQELFGRHSTTKQVIEEMMHEVSHVQRRQASLRRSDDPQLKAFSEAEEGFR